MTQKITPEKALINIINTHFEVNIRKRTRQRDVVDGRSVFFKILHDQGYSKTRLAAVFGMNHATVINSLNNFSNIVLHDNLLRIKYELCRSDFHRELNPIYYLTEDELRRRCTAIITENDLLKNENKYLHSLLDAKNCYSPLFNIIKERVPVNKVDKYKTKLIRFFNGVYSE